MLTTFGTEPSLSSGSGSASGERTRLSGVGGKRSKKVASRPSTGESSKEAALGLGGDLERGRRGQESWVPSKWARERKTEEIRMEVRGLRGEDEF